jgi:hypothetical protein
MRLSIPIISLTWSSRQPAIAAIRPAIAPHDDVMSLAANDTSTFTISQ